LFFAAVATARADEFPTVPYALVEGSTYQEGCFDPCECPLLQEQPMTGSFDVVFYPFAGPLWTVAVENVAWSVPTLGKEITGHGIYRRAGSQHSLQLELQIDGEPPIAFDSGWVEGGALYPFIDITVTKNNFFCYDIVLHVRAKPTGGPRLTVDGTQLVWTPLGEAVTYDVVRGDLATLRASGGDFGVAVDACLADGCVENTLPQDVVLAPGEAVWFLVRPQGGTYDEGGAGQAGPRDENIAQSPLACP
jgi:hypothetical protein